MLFNSLHFFVFFPVVVFLYFIFPFRFKWVLLLAASYYFYMSWRPEYAILLVISTFVAYFGAIMMNKTSNQKIKKYYLFLSLFIILGILFIFKYFNFFNNNLRETLDFFGIFYNFPAFSLLLPIGISFYTFQKISYLVDVYRGQQPVEKHLGIFALYSSFFPQLVAGPIERPGHLLPQFKEKHYFNYLSFIQGLKLMMWGMFLKMVIADRCALLVNQIYNHPNDYDGIILLIATYFFAIQLYADFAGYSLIALGAAKVLGFNLIDNFNKPYFAKNISEFWNHWHISLTNWIQDYVFTPFYFFLSRNKFLSGLPSNIRHTLIFIMAVLASEFIFGLWHGANWRFVFFGLYFGVLIVLYHLFKMFWNKLPPFLQVIINFHLVLPGFILFRSNSLADAFYVISHMFSNIGYIFSHLYELGSGKNILGATTYGLGKTELIATLVMIFFAFLMEAGQSREKLKEMFFQKPLWLRWVIYYFIIFNTIIFGYYGRQQFIYFQF